MRYIFHYTQPGDIIYDGFAGTGMTGAAANMCGETNLEQDLLFEQVKKKLKLGRRKSINGDLSPIASFIAGKYNTSHNTKKLVEKALNIIKEIDSEYKWLYETLHNDGKTKGTINFIVWSEVFS